MGTASGRLEGGRHVAPHLARAVLGQLLGVRRKLLDATARLPRSLESPLDVCRVGCLVLGPAVPVFGGGEKEG